MRSCYEIGKHGLVLQDVNSNSGSDSSGNSSDNDDDNVNDNDNDNHDSCCKGYTHRVLRDKFATPTSIRCAGNMANLGGGGIGSGGSGSPEALLVTPLPTAACLVKLDACAHTHKTNRNEKEIKPK